LKVKYFGVIPRGTTAIHVVPQLIARDERKKVREKLKN